MPPQKPRACPETTARARIPELQLNAAQTPQEALPEGAAVQIQDEIRQDKQPTAAGRMRKKNNGQKESSPSKGEADPKVPKQGAQERWQQLEIALRAALSMPSSRYAADGRVRCAVAAAVAGPRQWGEAAPGRINKVDRSTHSLEGMKQGCRTYSRGAAADGLIHSEHLNNSHRLTYSGV